MGQERTERERGEALLARINAAFREEERKEEEAEREVLSMAARIRGRRGGLASRGRSSEAKQRASRENGRKGGRPKRRLSESTGQDGKEGSRQA